MGKWNGHTFEVSSKLIRGFKELTIKASCETKDKDKSKQYYVAYQKAKGVEVSLTVTLSARLGCDVRNEVMGFVKDARAGASDYFYVGNGKLWPCKMMLTDVSVKDVTMPGGKNAGAKWTGASVQLTLKQATIDDTEPKKSSSSSSSKKKSTKKTSSSSSSSKSTGTGTVVAKPLVQAALAGAAKTVEAAKASSKTSATTNLTTKTTSSISKVTKVLGR